MSKHIKKDFSHTSDFTKYMKAAFDIICSDFKSQGKILDIPAGNGKFSIALQGEGFKVASADINKELPGYVYANMSEPLPFKDDEFDAVSCLEGIEHIIDPALLIKEFQRIVKPGGNILISTPNIQSMFSRLKFICTGYFFLFEPQLSRHIECNNQIDRGHISPMSYLQLRYLLEEYGFYIEAIKTDKIKKKFLLPLYAPFILIGWLWAYRDYIRGGRLSFHREIIKDLFSKEVLLGRTLVMSFKHKG
jgi:SAM-dependent methyltransferase